MHTRRHVNKSALKDQEKVSESLELELQTAVSHPSGNQTQSPAGVVVLVTTDQLLLTLGFFALGWSALQAAVSLVFLCFKALLTLCCL